MGLNQSQDRGKLDICGPPTFFQNLICAFLKLLGF